MSRPFPALCLIVIAAVWALLFLGFPAGLFTVDEAIQIAGVDAMARTGGLIVENDALAPGHKALRVWYLRPAPEGLAPQYPSGFALLAAPFWMLGGVKGVMAANFVAALGVAALTGLIARDATGLRRAGLAAAALAMAGTYLAEYALGVWPHAIAVLISTFAIWAALRAVATGDWRWSLAVGLALGFGGLIRVDVWFLVPALAMWAVLASARPIRDLCLDGVGLAPGLLAASLLNWMKFGHFFPASYGQSAGGGGSVSAGGYNFALLVLVIAAIAAVAARLTRPVWGWAIGLAGLAVISLLAGGLDYIVASARGVWVLGVDLRDYKGVDIDRFVHSTPEGGVVFYFMLKKALAQSMPWLGVLPALWLLRRGETAGERRFISLLAIAALTLLLFFASREWHGGLSSNQRYLLPLAPLFAVGAIIALARLPGRAAWGWGAGAVAGAALLYLFVAATDLTTFKVETEQNLPPLLFGALLLLTVIAGVAPASLRPAAGAAVRAGAGAAVALATFSVFSSDVLTSFNRRAIAADRAEMVAATPPRSLVYSGGFAGSWPVFQLPDVALAAVDRVTGDVAHDLTPLALDQGWRVFADDAEVAATILAAYPDLAARVLIDDPYRAEITRPE